ncbi:F-box domain containing protein [Trema orientale]|uniref:F-box domain containing protein n=1 Tax=Trema orientale TaxID=63057 RepID=A0A2P5BNP2_TREOI|nr:F-box domain containing protein [Trema orientale]
MALGKKCRTSFTPKRSNSLVSGGDEGFELGLVKYTRAFGRKRILITNNGEDTPLDSISKTPFKKNRFGKGGMVLDQERSSDYSPLEALPQEILIMILCGVDHEDLNQLSHVSKAFREATLVAKQTHFAYSTPKKVRAFRTAIDLEDSTWADDEIEAPNAPKQSRVTKSRLEGKKLDSISVNLFA